ncbi:MAG: hypothetical protein JJU45_00885 [Acidimicrobiia bacterium]|nr:hypothetical protein [Acidimicrobiia bacterium]
MNTSPRHRSVIRLGTRRPDRWRFRAVVAVLTALIIVAAGCGGDDGASADGGAVPVDTDATAEDSASSDAADGDTDGGTDGGTDGETVGEGEDFEAQANDFIALADMAKVRGMFIDNPLGYLDEAIAVAENPEGGRYPVGTVIQLIPQEAMVKRAPGFDPASNDWEFFELAVDEDGTRILNRGGSEIINQFGMSCADCHKQADERFDMICEKDNGCEPLPLGDDFFEALQVGDPRPTRDGN